MVTFNVILWLSFFGCVIYIQIHTVASIFVLRFVDTWETKMYFLPSQPTMWVDIELDVIHADKDVQKFTDNTLSGIDAAQDKIKCPPDSFNADFCAGCKDGYSDEAMDQ